MNTNIYEIKLEYIANSIYEQTYLYPKTNGLFCGKGGLVLFLYYYYTYTSDIKYKNRAKELLAEIFKSFNESKEIDITYAEGVAGIYSMLFHLKRESMLTDFILEKNDDVEKIVYDACIYSINNKNFDFLYGSAGLLWSLFIKYETEPTETTYIKIKHIIINIHHLLQKDKDLFACWMNEKGLINLGMAHGIASWISILSSLFMKGFKFQPIIDILELLVDYYIPFVDLYNPKSIFPCDYNINKEIKEEKISSRLGWCYGDITCIISLLKYCIISNNKPLSNNLKNRLIKETILRKDLYDNRIFDAGICHGSAGIAYLYNKLYHYCMNQELLETSRFWYKKTLDFSTNNNECAGYKMYYKTYIGEVSYEDDMGLLEGIAGIGLSLLSYICPKYDKWGILLGI